MKTTLRIRILESIRHFHFLLWFSNSGNYLGGMLNGLKLSNEMNHSCLVISTVPHVSGFRGVCFLFPNFLPFSCSFNENFLSHSIIRTLGAAFVNGR